MPHILARKKVHGSVISNQSYVSSCHPTYLYLKKASQNVLEAERRHQAGGKYNDVILFQRQICVSAREGSLGFKKASIVNYFPIAIVSFKGLRRAIFA